MNDQNGYDYDGCDHSCDCGHDRTARGISLCLCGLGKGHTESDDQNSTPEVFGDHLVLLPAKFPISSFDLSDTVHLRATDCNYWLGLQPQVFRLRKSVD